MPADGYMVHHSFEDDDLLCYHAIKRAKIEKLLAINFVEVHLDAFVDWIEAFTPADFPYSCLGGWGPEECHC